MKPGLYVFAAVFLTGALSAQKTPPVAATTPWELQNSTTSAGLRGIHAVGGGVAWASGANGTILRTEDGGYMWQSCAIPPGAEKLDFRGIWAWDANTAVAMSSGPGDLSRLYKTTDGCSSWKLLYTNPDKDGFWDAVIFSNRDNGLILGDPVDGRFVLLFTLDGGKSWDRIVSKELNAGKSKIGAFAASNSSILYESSLPWFGASGPAGPYVYTGSSTCTNFESADVCWNTGISFERQGLPMAGGSAAAGIFSLGAGPDLPPVVVAVGGDYLKPNESTGTAAYTTDAGKTWFAAAKPPHGYRSAVAWGAADKAHPEYWIAVGTNGSDVSYNDGKTWQYLDSGNWNALSLPWVVGPEGRIAKLVSLKPAGP
jgi:photosystem II stability/assembly factor-like uncharacterized protein